MSANGLYRIRWRRVAVERVHRTAACQFARDLICIQQSIDGGGGKCWQTDSIGSDGEGLPWNESIGLPHVSPRDT